MGSMPEIRFFKELALPDVCQPNSMYFVLNSTYSEIYVTDGNGVPKKGGNTQMINDLIAQSSGGANAIYFTAANKDTINLTKGTPVAQHPSGSGFIRAVATSNATPCIGLLADDVNSGLAGRVQTAGTLMLADWTGVVGTESLAPSTKYYLDAVGGKLNNISQTTGSYISQLVGVSIDIQTIEIKLGYAILL